MRLKLLLIATFIIASCQSPDEIRLEHEQRLEKQTAEMINNLTYARDKRGNCYAVDRMTWHFAVIKCSLAE